ncbi:MAG: hypothetical protein AB1798_01865 [Spirochaetota bacterium]
MDSGRVIHIIFKIDKNITLLLSCSVLNAIPMVFKISLYFKEFKITSIVNFDGKEYAVASYKNLPESLIDKFPNDDSIYLYGEKSPGSLYTY